MIRVAPQLQKYSKQELMTLHDKGMIYLEGDTLVPVASGGSTALPLLNDAESGTSGTTVTTANSGGTNSDAFDNVVPGTNMSITFSNAAAAHETLSYALALTSTATAATYFVYTFPAQTEISGAWYFRMSVLPTSSIRHIQFLSGASLIGYIWGPESGTAVMEYRNSAGTLIGTTTSSSLFSVNNWYRVEFDVQFGASVPGSLTAYAGDSTTGITGGTASFSATSFGTSCDTIYIGITTANYSATSGATLFLDDMNFNSGNVLPIGPGPYSKVATPIPLKNVTQRVRKVRIAS